MAVVRVKLNRRNVAALLKDERVRADLEGRAKRIAAQAGPGMSYDSIIGRNRARATVWTDTPEAMVNEARSGSLSSAIDAGRG
jgi:hypothetical protein